ncbi:hypothetical protein RND81_08G052000 [Saponaria officinalis]|uniref:Uncharacterized protein n=1 Tax=Saponaria officinalis TaxID=3572 RepID=A0AAW1J3I4_SAPOF
MVYAFVIASRVLKISVYPIYNMGNNYLESIWKFGLFGRWASCLVSGLMRKTWALLSGLSGLSDWFVLVLGGPTVGRRWDWSKTSERASVHEFRKFSIQGLGVLIA